MTRDFFTALLLLLLWSLMFLSLSSWSFVVLYEGKRGGGGECVLWWAVYSSRDFQTSSGIRLVLNLLSEKRREIRSRIFRAILDETWINGDSDSFFPSLSFTLSGRMVSLKWEPFITSTKVNDGKPSPSSYLKWDIIRTSWWPIVSIIFHLMTSCDVQKVRRSFFLFSAKIFLCLVIHLSHVWGWWCSVSCRCRKGGYTSSSSDEKTWRHTFCDVWCFGNQSRRKILSKR